MTLDTGSKAGRGARARATVLDKAYSRAPKAKPIPWNGIDSRKSGSSATQTCTLHLTETWNCLKTSVNLAVQVEMKDSKGTVLANIANTRAGDSTPLKISSSLKDQLVITPEHTGDYIQFTLGSLSWKSGDKDDKAAVYCKVGGWDPKTPACRRGFTDDTVTASKRQMDCWFQC
ncbi:hypothetical protein EJ08DRAFT_653521 [Tothia fuscella]|uniref:Uncharacterized protein n=1 Tax=Tothia fuscella TaxID=1048955 RepID=A0A9P4NH74_9PEZI|nr:hypothetical protein EJ08DRAFT_653521 [Tothia fuscella]